MVRVGMFVTANLGTTRGGTGAEQRSPEPREPRIGASPRPREAINFAYEQQRHAGSVRARGTAGAARSAFDQRHRAAPSRRHMYLAVEVTTITLVAADAAGGLWILDMPPDTVSVVDTPATPSHL